MKQGRRVKQKAFLVGIVSRWGTSATLAKLLNQEMTITRQFGFDYDLKIYVFLRGSGCANYNRPGVYTRFVLPSSFVVKESFFSNFLPYVYSFNQSQLNVPTSADSGLPEY